ncbi:hypothetical protein AGMMS49991_07680 [Spirochaetia bacterium]|nr:hypothetical protein AGMMS49991_07680 [Spirochaetia bacterium]
MRLNKQALIDREDYPNNSVVKETFEFYFAKWHFHGIEIPVEDIAADLTRLGYLGDALREAWEILSVIDPYSDKLPDDLQIKPFASTGSTFYSSPVIDSSKVKDSRLREAVEAIGPTKWWRNTSSQRDAYSFKVRAAGHSSFSISLNDHNQVFDLMGTVMIKGQGHHYSEEGSKERDIFPILKAIAKPTPEAIVEAFNKDLGWTEDN